MFAGWLWIWPAIIKIVCQIFWWRSTALLYGRIWYRCCDLVKGREVWFNLWFCSLYCRIPIFEVHKFLNFVIFNILFFALLAKKTNLLSLFRCLDQSNFSCLRRFLKWDFDVNWLVEEICAVLLIQLINWLNKWVLDCWPAFLFSSIL